MRPSNFSICLLLGLLNSWVVAAVPAGQEGDWEKLRSMAEAEHEIVMLLISDGDFAAVPAETEKIFSMEFPAKHHGLWVEGTQEIVDALIHHQQYELGQKVVDQCMAEIENPALLSELHKMKAYLFKKMGRDDEAMAHFRKAVDLAGSP